MTDGIGIRISGRDQAFATLSDVAARTSNPLGLWQAIGVTVEASVQERFLAESGPDAQVWPKSLRPKLEGGKTLTDSARLMQSITSNATSDGVEIGTNVLYAAIHQFGGTITAKTEKGLRFAIGKGKDKRWAVKKSVTIPARPFLGIDNSDETQILDIATRWLEGAADAR